MRTTVWPFCLGVLLALRQVNRSPKACSMASSTPSITPIAWRPTLFRPQEIVDRMLELADLKPGEKLYDLGSGDGRILITAVARFKAKAVGVEISDELVNSTNARIRRLGLDNDAQVIHGNFLNVDLSPADVVTLYLATDANEMLRPNLEKYLKKGARVVSHEYAMPGWKPKLVDKDPEGHGHTIYLYEMPPKKK